MTRIHLLTVTPMGILIVYRDRLRQFRVIGSDGSVFGESKHYYTAQAAERAGRGWMVANHKQTER